MQPSQGSSYPWWLVVVAKRNLLLRERVGRWWQPSGHRHSPRTQLGLTCNNMQHYVVSLDVFKRSPQRLKAGIVATAAFNRFLEFSMYSQRCMSAGSVVACSACDLIPPAASPYLSPCTLAKPQGKTKEWGPMKVRPRPFISSLYSGVPKKISPVCQDSLGCARDKTRGPSLVLPDGRERQQRRIKTACRISRDGVKCME